MNWIEELFGTTKPVIAMCHLGALPGDPYYDQEGGMRGVVDAARRDLVALQGGGVDSVMFSNEFSLPYLTEVRSETTVAMARVIGELMADIRVPFGVNVLWDPYASIDLAAATGARFIREIMTGVYASDFGLWNTSAGKTLRHRRELGLQGLKMFFNIVPEAAKYLGDRDVCEVARSTVFNNRPDALCVSGLTAGVETDTQVLGKVKQCVPDTAVFCNTGCTLANIDRQLAAADGAIVGTSFKIEGKFENPVDEARVRAFMAKVTSFRKDRGGA